MKKPAAIVIASLGLVLCVLGGAASCKQGPGERCQRDSDCEQGVCTVATNTCDTRDGGALDVPPAPDASIDAPTDGM